MKTFFSKSREIDNVIIPCRFISKISFDRSEFVTKAYDKRFDRMYKDKYFTLLLNFPHGMFKEIVLVRSFDAQTLIGNAGGYIGLCLGYTFLQLPTFFSYVFAYLKHRGKQKETITSNNSHIVLNINNQMYRVHESN